MVAHCTERHPQDTYFFLHIHTLETLADETYTVRYHIQKMMRKVAEGTIPLGYDLFLTALAHNDPIPLKLALAKLFGRMEIGLIGTKNIKDMPKYSKFRHGIP